MTSLRSKGWRLLAMAMLALAGACVVISLSQEQVDKVSAHIYAMLEEHQQTTINLANWNSGVADVVKASLPTEVASFMNFSVPPCDNFYEFVCGHWIEEAEIPDDRGAYTKSWDGAAHQVHKDLMEIYTKHYPPHSEYRKLTDWFASCMDLEGIEKLGPSPLQPLLHQIDSMETVDDFHAILEHFVTYDIPSFIDLDVSVGVRSQTRHLLFISGTGIVLPDESYYKITYNGTAMGDDKASERENLRHYYKKINMLVGASEHEAEVIANKSLEIETKIAQWRADEPPVPDIKGPQLANLSYVIEQAPDIPWRRIFLKLAAQCKERDFECAESILNNTNNIIFTDKEFFKKLGKELTVVENIKKWIPFLRTHMIYNLGPLLNHDFLLASLELDMRMSGVTALPERAVKCVRATTHGLSALSDLKFLEVHFGQQAKDDGWAILNRIKSTFIRNLDSVSWMDEETKARALVKAHAMELNLGSPASYTEIKYDVGPSYFNNSALAYHVKVLRMLIELDRPLTSATWNMRATTVNAYYDNGLNALFIPAGIMQPPFFSDKYPMAQNFGSIGAIMGHEMTHGFDNTGSRFNEHRQMEEWWSKEVLKEFKNRTKCIQTLYDHFEIADTKVEGDSTLGENIADFGGTKIAYHAFVEWYNETKGMLPPPSASRLFFISYGQNWCDKERYKAQKMNIGYDNHSPNPFRTNGVVSQNPNFGDIFSCPAGSPMHPVHQCVLWKDLNPTEVLSSLPRSKGGHGKEEDEEAKGMEKAAKRLERNRFSIHQRQ